MIAAQKLRVDRWLWAARFYKTRSLAAKAINGGHVHVNGSRVKPARTIQLGDELRITKGAYTFVVVVMALGEKRGPAALAQTLYNETESSIKNREQLRLESKLINKSAIAPSRKPDKRDRRKIRKFQRKD